MGLLQIKSITGLLAAYQQQALSAEACIQELEQIIQLCRSRQKRLPQIEVSADDFAAWDSLIRPGLVASYRCVAAAAEEAQLYVKKGDAALFPGIITLLENAGRINRVLADSLKLLSGWTRDQIAQELAERIQSYQREGLATHQLAFLEPEPEG